LVKFNIVPLMWKTWPNFLGFVANLKSFAKPLKRQHSPIRSPCFRGIPYIHKRMWMDGFQGTPLILKLCAHQSRLWM
jgi:hypothetical protein